MIVAAQCLVIIAYEYVDLHWQEIDHWVLDVESIRPQ